MAKKNPAESFEKWQKGMAAAGPEYAKGIERTTVNPMQKAAAAVDKYRANVLKSVDDGTYVNSLNSTDISEWKNGALKKGKDALVGGAREISSKKRTNIMNQLQKAQQISETVQAMPNMTEADADARMLENVKLMRATKKGRS